ncbi:flagellar hook-length control protein FliK [Austwickia chelonae]|uniref:flagellar hook-length control protein FliK n=1 Tax=Austwickia chelonae TaxID=100225 RepID=UPI000E246801|nr:flagellar hook-length control protein FliK [Austwickia chelonae]
MTIRVPQDLNMSSTVPSPRPGAGPVDRETFAESLRAKLRTAQEPTGSSPRVRSGSAQSTGRPVPNEQNGPVGRPAAAASGRAQTSPAATRPAPSGGPGEQTAAGTNQPVASTPSGPGEPAAIPAAPTVPMAGAEGFPLTDAVLAQTASVVGVELAVMVHQQQSAMGRLVVEGDPAQGVGPVGTAPASGGQVVVAPASSVPGADLPAGLQTPSSMPGGASAAQPGAAFGLTAANGPSTAPTTVPGSPANEAPSANALENQPHSWMTSMSSPAAEEPGAPVSGANGGHGILLPGQRPPAADAATSAPLTPTPQTAAAPAVTGTTTTAQLLNSGPPATAATTTDQPEFAIGQTTGGFSTIHAQQTSLPQTLGTATAPADSSLPHTPGASEPSTMAQGPAAQPGTEASESLRTPLPAQAVPTRPPSAEPDGRRISLDTETPSTIPQTAKPQPSSAPATETAPTESSTPTPATDRAAAPTQPTPPPLATPPAHAPSVTTAGHSMPAQAAAPPAPVHSQLLTAIAPVIQRRDGSYNVELQLDPASLGRVKVTVTMQAGEISVQMQAADSGARDMLRQNMDQLRDQLADAGFGRTNVDVGDGSRQAWQDPRGQQPRDLPGNTSTQLDPAGTPLPGDRPAVSETTDGTGPLDLQL